MLYKTPQEGDRKWTKSYVSNTEALENIATCGAIAIDLPVAIWCQEDCDPRPIDPMELRK